MAMTNSTTIVVNPIKRETITLAVIGTTPLLPRSIPAKAWQELLLPSGRKTAADKAATQKHDPFAEFAVAAPILDDPTATTLLAVKSTTFKGAMMTAALDVPGARKAQIGRLVFVEGDWVGVYGRPQLHMSVVRNADINHTPDVRTRVIVAQWGAFLRITYVVPAVNETSIVNLLNAAGTTAGVGDYRPERSGQYGQFRLIAADDPEFTEVVKVGRKEQEAAMANPEPYDRETAELLEWFTQERARRGIHIA